MEQILEKRTITGEGCPFTCPLYKGGEIKYEKGMLPQTDALLSRAINISIGVSDAGLGSAFGVTMGDGIEVVDDRAAEFHKVAGRYLK
jgi:8-amino-3,8-dideoxy-alpha-D-manno-octulosonate transaminase